MVPENTPQTQGQGAPVIAISAMAGGVEACSALLKALPADLPFAIVLFLNLDPMHDSMMLDLLARESRLKIVRTASDVALCPGHIYVMTPGIFLAVRGGILQTVAPESVRSGRQPCETFLKSLTKDAPFRMGCMFLSGTGADGSAALGATHSACGLITVQDPQEAAQSQMLGRALKTNLVDLGLRAADRASVTKSQVLAAASHDLRQPLQSLTLLHGLMSRDMRSDEGPRLAALMDCTLNAMSDMLDSLLDVSRIESGVLRPDFQPIAIAPLMAGLRDELAVLCEVRGLKFRLVQCNAWVRTDPRFLRQILRSLLSNALKYTSKGGILMGCRIRGDQLLIQIWDSGIGIAETERKAIFEACHRTEPSRGQGLGLGLSIVQRLAKLLDHPVSVNSTPGKGSVFTLTLPIICPDHKAPSQTLHSRAQVDAPRKTGAILLVAENDDLRTSLFEVLEGEGHSVTAMSSARDAVAWAMKTARPPDLLLTDFELRGGGSGLSLAQSLADGLGFSLPTIVLTGDNTVATMQDIAAAHLEQIAKPVCPDVLLERISELLQSCGSASAGRPARRHAPLGSAQRPPGSKSPECPALHMVDDDPTIREATGRVFEAEGWSVITYPSAEAFLAAPRPGPGACLAVDGRLPGIDGVELLETLREEGALLPTVLLTEHGDVSMAVNAMKAGAADVIEKPASAAELITTVRRALEKSTGVHVCTTAQHNARKAFDALTPRERDVLDKVLKGAPNKIIAAELGINQRTVENHRAAVMRKTGATSFPELFRLALVAGVASLV